MRKARQGWGLVLAAALGMAMAAGCAKKPAQPPAQAGTAGGAPVAQTSKDIEAFGVVVATATRDLNIDFPAVIKTKFVREGQRLKYGEAIFQLSTEDYTAQIDAAALQQSQAEFELKQIISDHEKLQEQLLMAQADADKAQRDADAKQKMFSVGGTSASDVEDAKRNLDAKRESVSEIQRSLDENSDSRDMQNAKISNFKDQRERLQAKSAVSFVSGDRVVCDVQDGIVYDIGYAVGDYVSRDHKLCSLLDASSLIVQANVPEEFAKDVKVGSKADIVPLSDNSKTYNGKVTRISNMATKANGETVVAIDIAIDKPDGFLKPNFNVDVKLY